MGYWRSSPRGGRGGKRITRWCRWWCVCFPIIVPSFRVVVMPPPPSSVVHCVIDIVLRHPIPSSIPPTKKTQSTSKVEDLIGRTGLRRDSVYKLICLPPISRRGGCALLQPAPAPSPTSSTLDDNGSDDDEESIDDNDSGSGGANNNVVRSILDALGGYVECRDDDVMEAMMVTTCMMGPMYGVMRTNRDWLGEFFFRGTTGGGGSVRIYRSPHPIATRLRGGPRR